MAAKLTFEFDGIEPVVIELPAEKAALITNEFIEAYNGPVDGEPHEKLLFLVQQLKQYVIETAAGNYARKAREAAAKQAELEAKQAFAIS